MGYLEIIFLCYLLKVSLTNLTIEELKKLAKARKVDGYENG